MAPVPGNYAQGGLVDEHELKGSRLPSRPSCHHTRMAAVEKQAEKRLAIRVAEMVNATPRFHVRHGVQERQTDPVYGKNRLRA
jgi:hypothetical protein